MSDRISNDINKFNNDVNNNILIITRSASTGASLHSSKDFIDQNDKKQPQAYLELSIIELSESGSRDFANTWQVWSKFFTGTFDGTTATQNGND